MAKTASKTAFESSATEFVDLWLETYENTVGRMWESATVGPSRERAKRTMKGFAGMGELIAAWTTSNINLQNVFMEAMRRTQEKTMTDGGGTISADAHKDYYKIWIEVYSDTFREFLSSGHFAAEQGELMTRTLEFQRFNRDMLEENYLRPMNLPTKSEMDEVNKELYAAKKALKGMRRQLAQSPTRAEFDALREELDALRKPGKPSKGK